MLGFSVYLNQPLDATRLEQMRMMADAGFTGVFTSMHIPEDDPHQYLTRVRKLGQVCRELNLQLTADVSAAGMQRMGVDIKDAAALAELGLTALRIDDGVPMTTIAALSHLMPIALNASTISPADVQALTVAGANFEHLEAWHNYYPRPETGLDADWVLAKNQWLKAQGFTTMAFVMGDTDLRGPLHVGLPTLEADRGAQPLAATLNLQRRLLVDKVYVGDSVLSSARCEQFKHFFKDHTLQLSVHTTTAQLLATTWHNRPDVARDVVRLVEGRQKIHQLAPANTVARPLGAVTIDNDRYGRYVGELQIMKTALPANERVNVVGQVAAGDLALLPWIDSNQAVQFIKEDDGN
ncbi:DUF871 domain-containing protein [Lactiplantibacillus garii]|uniref:DUF871 domain-containing protein n=1 Tax=Lactiplantibacillus garii TaxID=2306423 RepID=A0A426D6W5_9LACO|nr:MupG family TIM beta-alpha barrel fold protein [Lactiplantibacillus garii]RRK10169.1 DUF871 domain-containing protein [Lactiplantibacillus garii]